MTRAFIAVGSNLGDRQRYLDEAKKSLGKTLGVKILRTSSIHETHPVGGPVQGKYLNAVWEIQTDLNPRALLERLLEIEKELGRERTQKNAPRTIDLDILFYDHRVVEEPGLTIPHPRLHERAFVLKPLGEIAPQFRHPRLKKTVHELLENILHETHSRS